jgi:hypothetical protein
MHRDAPVEDEQYGENEDGEDGTHGCSLAQCT